MKLGFKVLEPGLHSSFQDRGRFSYRQLGVPISGAFDQKAYEAACLLVSNPESPVLEMTGIGCRIEFYTDTVIAITGGEFNPMINGAKIPQYVSVLIRKGDVLSFSGCTSGFRAYIAFSHDYELSYDMDSYSTYEKLGMGGYKGRKLKKGDEIHITSHRLPKLYKTEPVLYTNCVRYIKSFEYDSFMNDLDQRKYIISGNSDRMGYRLEGEIIHAENYDVLSGPVFPGVIQITASGLPIVICRDGQTTGGYKRIGTIIQQDINMLAQLKPGDSIEFKEIELDDAINLIDNPIVLTPMKQYNLVINGHVYHTFVEEL